MRMGNRHAVALVVGVLPVLPATAGAVTPSTPTGPAAAKPFLDSRAADRAKAARAGTTVAAARPSARTRQARAELRRDLGRQGVDLHRPAHRHAAPAPAHRRRAQQPARRRPRPIAMDFLRANRDALGLDAADLDGLGLQRRTSTPRGLTVVRYRQLYRGIPAFDNDVRVAIDRAGRVHSSRGLAASRPRRPLGRAGLSGAEALARLADERRRRALAARDLGTDRHAAQHHLRGRRLRPPRRCSARPTARSSPGT